MEHFASFFVMILTATIIVLGNRRPRIWDLEKKKKDNGKLIYHYHAFGKAPLATTNALSRSSLKIRINLINFKWLCTLTKPRIKENGNLVQMYAEEKNIKERRQSSGNAQFSTPVSELMASFQSHNPLTIV